ncbi:tape measure protein [Pseudomonas sp. PARCl1]|uniref:tape measure protein n=1 Tax=Pseudomonas sp. PARCl1 TaxID=2853444 RepID=UPI001C73E9DB|nr:tape measure protein [Pseudomonas sp. PARCl1]QXM18731.1 tape measure protein [Pseudomonas phage PARCL1pr]
MAGQTLRSLVVSVSAETSAYQREMSRASRMGQGYLRTIAQGNREAAAGWRSQQAAIDAQNGALQGLTATAGDYFRTMAGALAAGSIIAMADDWNSVNARLKLASASQADFLDNQKAIFEISQKTGTAFGSNANLFSRSAASLREFGYTSSDAVKLTEVLATGLQVSGASAEETSSVVTQMSQALAQGVLRGEEFNAVNESGDRIIRALAAGMGVQRRELKGMADDGKLTIDKVVPALISQLGVLREEYKQMPNSVSSGFTTLKNAMQAWVGGMDGATGSTQALSSALTLAGNNLDLLAAGAAATGVTYLTKRSLEAVAALRAQVIATRAATSAEIGRTAAQMDSAAMALRVAQADVIAAQRRVAFATSTAEAAVASRALTAAKLAELEATTALTAAQTANAAAASLGARAGAGLLSLLGGPVGLAALVAGTAAGFLLFSSNAEAANSAAVDLKRPIADLRKEWEELGNAQRRPILSKLIEEQEAAKAKAAEIVKEMQAVAQGPSGDYLGGQRFGANQYQRQAASANFRRSIAGGIDVDEATQNLASSIQPNEEVRSTLQQLAGQYQETIGQVSVLGDQITTLNGVMDGAKTAAEGVGQGLNSIQPPSATTISAWEKRIANYAEQAAKLKDPSELGEVNRAIKADGLDDTEAGRKLAEQARAAAREADAQAAAKKAREEGERLSKQASEAAARRAKQLDDAFKRQLATLKEQAAVHGATTELAKVRYATTQGELKGLTDLQKKELERAATAKDALDAQKAYRDLIAQSESAEQKLLTQMRERVRLLKEAQAAGGVSPEQYDKATGQFSKAAITKAPTYGGLDGAVGGPAGELMKVAKAQQELEQWQEAELERQKTFLNEKLINEQQHADNVAAITQTNNERMSTLGSAYKMATLSMFSSMTGDALGMLEQLGQKGSAAYKVMFLANKAASIAQAIISTEVAAVQALTLGPVAGPPMAAMIRGLGYASVGMIAATALTGMAHDGIDNVPREGTWLLDQGERVVDRRTNGDLKNFLATAEAGKAAAGGGGAAPIVYITIESDGSAQTQAPPGLEQFGAELGAYVEKLHYRLLARDLSDGGTIRRAMIKR